MNIRRLNIFFQIALPALLLLTGLSACTDDDDIFDTGTHVAPGTPVEISLGLSVPQPLESLNVSSRADESTALNRQLYDLWLFLFDEEEGAGKGKLKSKFYFPSLTALERVQCDPSLSTNGSAQLARDGLGSGRILHIHTTAGSTRIVAVANTSVKGSSNIMKRMTDLQEGTGTFADLSDVMVSATYASGLHDFESELAVMSGFYCAVEDHPDHDNLCDQNHNGITTIDKGPLSGTVWLTPLQSRVRFVINGNGPAAVTDAKGNEVIPQGRFELTSWQVYNIPGQTPLFCDNTNSRGILPTNTREVTSKNTPYTFTATELAGGETAPDPANCYAFAFFPADNHPGDPKQEISNYGDRAAWEHAENATTATAPDAKSYTNAPDEATYVVLRGHYSGASTVTTTDKEEAVKEVSADVTYTIFLGHNSGSDFNDFDTYRNFNYTYIVTVKGVNTISVEVNKSEDPRPDAEGHVSVLDNKTEILDSHYEQRLYNISKKEIQNAINSKTFRMIIDEPALDVNSRIYRYFKVDEHDNYVTDADGNPLKAGDNDPENALQYMNWVQFYRHTADEIGKSYIPYTKAKSEGKLMTVLQFMDDLYNFSQNGENADDDRAYYTIYFDEYVYLDDEGNQVHPVTKETVSWKQLVGLDARTFTMLGSTKFSDDHNSSYSTAGTAFRQRQIQTVYNPNAGGLERAWGTECIEENIIDFEGVLYTGVPHGKAQRYYEAKVAPSGICRYGRQNIWRANAYRPFEDVIDSETGYLKRLADRKNHFYECMSRNRDLNGNGVLDPTELRWYLPSREQYQLLYVGKEGLSADAQIYNPQLEADSLFVKNGKITYRFKHYMTSSSNKIWSEEGCSEGDMAWGLTGDEHVYARVIFVRCVRDLGTDANVRDANTLSNLNNDANQLGRFQSIYDVVEGDALGSRPHVACRVKLSNLNNAAVRVDIEQRERPGMVNTFSASNRPVHEFEVADELITNIDFDGVEIPKVEGDVVQETECKTRFGAGWRMPTITELAAIKWARPDLVPPTTGSRTRSYYRVMGYEQDAWFHLPGPIHIYNLYGNIALQQNETNYRLNLRCVRDYDPNLTDADIPENDSGAAAAPARRRVRRK